MQLRDLDHRLKASLGRRIESLGDRLANSAAALRPEALGRRTEQQAARLTEIGLRLRSAIDRKTDAARIRLDSLDKLRLTLNPKRPPRPGFVLVTRPDGATIPRGGDLSPGDAVRLLFEDATRDAVIDGAPSTAPPARPAPKKAAPPSAGQGDLF